MSVVLIGNRRGGVGKTTIAINMASMLHEKGYRVLLVDGDQNASVRYIAKSVEKSIEDFFTLNLPLREVIVKRDDIDGILGTLKRLPPVMEPTDQALMGYKIYKEFKALNDSYDYIIIDGPAGREGLSWWGSLVDDTIIPCKDEIDITEPLDDYIKELKSKNIRLLGIVFNQIIVDKDDDEIVLTKAFKNFREENGFPVFSSWLRYEADMYYGLYNGNKPINKADASVKLKCDFERFVDEFLEKEKG